MENLEQENISPNAPLDVNVGVIGIIFREDVMHCSGPNPFLKLLTHHDAMSYISITSA